MHRRAFLQLTAAGLVGATALRAGDEDAGGALELIMVEQAGCAWCARWNREIGPIYPKSTEGQTAPLRRMDLHQPVPGDLTLDGRVIFTPTFILVRDGVEIDRLEGYPGEDFFWPILAAMLERAGDGAAG